MAFWRRSLAKLNAPAGSYHSKENSNAAHNTMIQLLFIPFSRLL